MNIQMELYLDSDTLTLVIGGLAALHSFYCYMVSRCPVTQEQPAIPSVTTMANATQPMTEIVILLLLTVLPYIKVGTAGESNSMSHYVLLVTGRVSGRTHSHSQEIRILSLKAVLAISRD